MKFELLLYAWLQPKEQADSFFSRLDEKKDERFFFGVEAEIVQYDVFDLIDSVR